VFFFTITKVWDNQEVSKNELLIQNICKEEITQVEKDGYISNNTKSYVESKLTSFKNFNITGTVEKVSSGNKVFIQIDIKYINLFGELIGDSIGYEDGIAK
jgi:hypothetical protein